MANTQYTDKNQKDNIHIVKPKKDLTGQVFGKLTVLRLSDQLGSRGNRLVPQWECQCECGCITYKATDTLTNPDISMCKDCAAEYAIIKVRDGAGYVEGTQISKIKNIKRESDNASGIRGVYYESKTGKYRARVSFQGKNYSFGSYSSIEEAAKARKAGEEELFGTFLNSLSNKPKDEKPSLDAQISSAASKAAKPSLASGHVKDLSL